MTQSRRFGKSLFLYTLKELFEGNEPLFEGLVIHDQWDWSVRHLVLRLSFGSGNFKEPGFLHGNLMDQLNAIERRAGVIAESATAPGRFAHLLEALRAEAGQPVAVLVDEYDKPILDALEEPETARANRDYLRGLYATIKDSDAHIAFTFLTGVSKFSKVSLFSGLNNLIDITLDPHYSAICGYNLTDNPSRRVEHSARLYDLLLVNDFDSLKTLFEAFFASIPYQWHTNNEIANYEGYYASVFYSYFASLGLAITVEDSSSKGRLDMAVLFNGNVYLFTFKVFEFKVVRRVLAEAAIWQLKERDYAAKYRGRGEPIYLIGVEFSRQTRTLAAFEVERV